MQHEITVQVIVTIIVSIATWLFLKFTDKVIIPWIEKYYFKGIEIKGIWTATTNIKSKKYDKHNFMNI